MLKVKGRIWIESENGAYIGYGRIKLLKAIDECGSITEAAKETGMSYRHAWEMIDSMNKLSDNPLVQTITGGKGGGGTRLTNDGVRLLRRYWKLYNNFKDFNEEQTNFLNQ